MSQPTLAPSLAALAVLAASACGDGVLGSVALKSSTGREPDATAAPAAHDSADDRAPDVVVRDDGSMPVADAMPPEEPDSGQPEPRTAPPESAWPRMGYDLESTFFNSAETKLTKDNAAQLRVLWRATMQGNVYAAPLQVGDRVYATDQKGIVAFDAASGNELWSQPVGSASTPSVTEDALYLNSAASGIVALRTRDGKQLWSRWPDTQSTDGLSSAIVVGDVVFVGAANGGIELLDQPFRGYVAALNRHTGAVVWITYTVDAPARGAGVWSSPSIDLLGRRVFAATSNNYGPPASNTSDAFIAFELKTGRISWINQRVQNDIWDVSHSSAPDADFGANPVLYEAEVYGQRTPLLAAGSKAGTAHAVRRDSGELVWTRQLCAAQQNGSDGIYLNSSWSGKHVLMACNADSAATLFALDGGTGDIVWMRKLPARVWSRISSANGVGFVGVGQTLDVFDLDSGAQIASYPSPGGTIASTISIANGRVAFGDGLSWSDGAAGNHVTVLGVP
ncbi:MAG TPA: PQQ-binding-like beta-propeller repeat protein [Polyangiales bacterium]|nr:PQQ-binding-like beta-propeller repeat protein [Polyangiales bacterium]